MCINLEDGNLKDATETAAAAAAAAAPCSGSPGDTWPHGLAAVIGRSPLRGGEPARGSFGGVVYQHEFSLHYRGYKSIFFM